MITEKLLISSNQLIARNTYEMKLLGSLAEEIKKPGQFLHIKVGEQHSFSLRRPVSIANINRVTKEITIVYKKVGEGTAWLSERRKGEQIDALGPLGNGYEINQIHNENLLIIGGGVGVPPLYYLAKQFATNNHVTVILGFQTRDDVFYEEKFKEVGQTFVSTEDGSYGIQGRVTDVMKNIEIPFTRYYACGPKPMLKAVQQQLNEIDGFISLEERMGCGIGACFACVCQAHNEKGYVKICKDGPVFNAKEVII
ncbi:dihydroorotate dehydrogenase electron transfer subunit [Bacillaceae bacterium W0354]